MYFNCFELIAIIGVSGYVGFILGIAYNYYKIINSFKKNVYDKYKDLLDE